ncbi:MAG TPA: ABC transporter ATP-binding protein [Cyanobacteria bacterium UBA11371]|nr:ABC transporter ATP-binding protein [Cyanobacteria bacterium UBA11371]HBE31046.1 ABC transporter ATP-binding protein [Cyanobacteria bacterium UBA11368]
MIRLRNLEGLDGKFWKKFWAIAKPYWVSEEKTGAISLLAILILLRLAFSSVVVYRTYLDRDFLNAISDKEIELFFHILSNYCYLFIFGTIFKVGSRYVEEKLGLYWRRWLTNHLLDKYCSDRNYYEIEITKKIDNPDQRIADETKAFTKTALTFFVLIVGETFDLIGFIAVLGSISPMLVVVAFLYSAFGSAIAVWAGKKLIRLKFIQLQREADFRYSLVHIRDHAESIAFYGGEAEETAQAKKRFDLAFNNFSRIVNWNRYLEFLSHGYNYVDDILPALVVAPMYFTGQVKFGVIEQSRKAFKQVVKSLSIIVNQFDDLSLFAAGVNRLSTFDETLSETPNERSVGKTSIDTVVDSRLALEQVTLLTPDSRKTLVKNVSVAVQAGEGLLIMGQSGTGKSSLLRAIAGLWNAGTGRLVRPRPEEMLFLPQRPYMLLGSLRLQLLYPNTQREISDEQLYETLKKVNLADLPERVGGFDAELDWADILSLGEQQRLAFARLLLCAPRYAILDESTSALDIKNEQLLYQQLQATGTTLIGVGHRPSLLSFHDLVLELEGNANWRLIPAQDYNPST